MKSIVSMLRVMLWPILWWGFSEALYCAPVQQLAPPPVPLRLDLSRVTQADIEQTVRHLQAIVRAADARAATLELNLASAHASLAAAETETSNVQTKMDTSIRERDVARERAAKAEAATDVERTWKCRWCAAWLGTVALFAAFFIARQYIPFLKLL